MNSTTMDEASSQAGSRGCFQLCALHAPELNYTKGRNEGKRAATKSFTFCTYSQ
jgi:hypothetical protein